MAYGLIWECFLFWGCGEELSSFSSVCIEKLVIERKIGGRELSV